MRIAYIAGFQSDSFGEIRNIRRRALAGSQKIALIADALAQRENEVIVFSHGVTGRYDFKFYGSYSEPLALNKQVSVRYSSAFNVKYINLIVSSFSLIKLLKEENEKKRFDIVLCYNLGTPEVNACMYLKKNNIPLVLEYEDDAYVLRNGKKGLKSLFWSLNANRIINHFRGCIAPSNELLEQHKFPRKYLLHGFVGSDIVNGLKNRPIKKNIVLFSGSLDKTKGVDLLVEAWNSAKIANWQLHITGKGPLSDVIDEISRTHNNIKFHGYLSREKFVELLLLSKLCINPHQKSQSPGNVFPFKVVEYIAVGSHVISTPLGKIEPEMENGITFAEFSVESIRDSLLRVTDDLNVDYSAQNYILNLYSANNISEHINSFLNDCIKN
jgi:glycosyltransferase involved in cell wall biosynthesis